MQTATKSRIHPLLIILGLSFILFVIFIFISFSVYFSNSTDGGRFSLGKSSAIGVIEVDGMIMDSKKVVSKLEKFEKNSAIKAVVIRLDSPGGSVAPSQEIYQAIKQFPKPVVASMGSVAASGAYYIACGAQKIYANPGTLTGSIGVIMEFVNMEDLYSWAKIKRYSVSSGKFKSTGAEYKDMTTEEKEIIQAMIDDVLEQFKQAVSDGRRMKMKDVAKYADGRIFSGNQAKDLKLVDELGTLTDAIMEAARLANIEGKPKVIWPKDKKDKLIDIFLEQDDEASFGALSGNVFSKSILSVINLILNNQSKNFTSEKQASSGLYWLWDGR